jgi:hypothetical protein
MIAAYCDSHPLWRSNPSQTARSRPSGEYFCPVSITPSPKSDGLMYGPRLAMSDPLIPDVSRIVQQCTAHFNRDWDTARCNNWAESPFTSHRQTNIWTDTDGCSAARAQRRRPVAAAHDCHTTTVPRDHFPSRRGWFNKAPHSFLRPGVMWSHFPRKGLGAEITDQPTQQKDRQ